uniref:Uncharacterized protein n=1 Tax=Parascaris equorum TaxID=6256 RepID=A0A914R9Z9_PAREQ
MTMINEWLTERLQQSLSPYQLTCLLFIVKKIYSDFELHGIDDERINSKTYQSITSTSNHALIGNATQAVSNMGSMVEGAGAKVFALFK